jgi:hypothetical protein
MIRPGPNMSWPRHELGSGVEMTFTSPSKTSPSGCGVRGRRHIKAAHEGQTQRLLVVLDGHLRPSAAMRRHVRARAEADIETASFPYQACVVP